MAWLSFSKSKDFDPVKFEKELANIAARINKNERNIIKLTYQERKLKGLFIFYAVLFYVFAVTYFFLRVHFHLFDLGLQEYFIIGGLPLIIIAVVKSITRLYKYRIKRLENSLEEFKAKHEDKIDELKQRTNFQSTQALLQRFTDGHDLDAQLSEELLQKKQELEEVNKLAESASLSGSKEFAAYPRASHWYDFVVDTIIGVDDLSPSNRFALICPNCHNHNGLAPPGKDPRYVKYVCPVCKNLNGEDQPLETLHDSVSDELVNDETARLVEKDIEREEKKEE